MPMPPRQAVEQRVIGQRFGRKCGFRPRRHQVYVHVLILTNPSIELEQCHLTVLRKTRRAAKRFISDKARVKGASKGPAKTSFSFCCIPLRERDFGRPKSRLQTGAEGGIVPETKRPHEKTQIRPS